MPALNPHDHLRGQCRESSPSRGAPEAQGGPLACVSHACAPAWGVSEAGRVGAREHPGQSQTDSGSSRHCSQDLHFPYLRGSGLYALGSWEGWRDALGGVAHMRGRVRRGPVSPSFFPEHPRPRGQASAGLGRAPGWVPCHGAWPRVWTAGYPRVSTQGGWCW